MPVIEITERDFARLKTIAEPLVDTSATAFTKVMDFFDLHRKTAQPESVQVKHKKLQEFNATNMPPLVHAKLLSAQFSDKIPSKASWDSLARLALETVYEKFGDVRELRRVSGANVVEGKKFNQGYKPLKSLPFSYQGMSAEDATKCVIRCAKALGCEVVFEFVWHQKDGAYLPGERAVVRVTG